MPAPAGQSFVIQAADSSRSGSLEFAQYAGLVRQQLMAQGYAPAPSPSAASLVVELDYGVSGGREKIDTRPGTGMYSPWGPWGWSPYYGRSEEHTSELQSLMRISYAVFCLKQKKNTKCIHNYTCVYLIK